jgi:hypothetical protein
MFFLHVLDHPSRCQITIRDNQRALFNPYVNFEGNRDNFNFKK